MAETPTNGSLNILDNLVHHLNGNQSISARILGRNQKNPCVHISHNFWPDHSGLTFCPSFYLLATHNIDKIELKCVAFNGKKLDICAEDHPDQDLAYIAANSRLLGHFVKGEIRICRGLPKSSKSLNDSNVLREAIEERIVARTRTCLYGVVVTDSDQKADATCTECRNHVPNAWPFQQKTGGMDPEIIKLEPAIQDFKRDDFIQLSDDVDSDDDVDEDYDSVKVADRLRQLKGITVARDDHVVIQDDHDVGSEDDNVVDNDDDDDDDDDEAAAPLTVVVGDGQKVLDFKEFKRDLDLESERDKIRGSGSSGMKRKGGVMSDVEKKQRKMLKLQQEEIDKHAAELRDKHVKHCPVCKAPFTSINAFMAHLSTCEVSSDEGSSSGEDEDDSEQDNNDETTALRKRMKKNKKKKRKKKDVKDVKSKSNEPPECTVCMTTFKHENSFATHIKAHEDKIDINAPVDCPTCHVEIESRKMLNPHFKEAHPELGGCCIECMEIMQVNLLKSHLSRKHAHAPEREGQLCPICGKKCYYTADLEIHIAVQHMGVALERPPKDEGEVMCHECGKVFAHRYRLKQHLATTHNKSRDHPCPFCAKVFCLKHQLTKHLLTHADVKPFKCKYCDYQNVRKYRVTKHAQKQHRVKGTDEDIEIMQGADKPSEFVHNVFGI